jgi:LDH2 family malate/lactate/ureidoglycolate dehydrogenase
MSEHIPQIPTVLLPTPGHDPERMHEVACQDCCICTMENRVMPQDLEDFVTGVMMLHHVPEHEARQVAQVLVASDVRGIASHGVARLSRYLTGIQDGYIVPGAPIEVVDSGPAVATIDAHNALGQVAGIKAMNLAIEKAEKVGVGLVTVKHSNHYGIAGYYPLMALKKRMIGVSLTNSAPLMVPTFGAEVMLGTNPIAAGAPAATHPDFLLDMATAVVPRGKLEVYDRNRKQMPNGWAVDEKGYDAQNPGHVLQLMMDRIGGGILPLGGRGEEFSGYKGFGLSLLVDILSGVLSGSAYSTDCHNLKRPVKAGDVAAPDIGHFFMAIDIGRFMPIAQFEARMDDYIERLKNSKKSLDADTIYIHGEKEYAKTQVHKEVGIPIAENVFKTLRKIATECGHPHPVTVSSQLTCTYGEN